MPIEVEMPDGAILEFPEDMSQDQIRSAIQTRFPAPAQFNRPATRALRLSELSAARREGAVNRAWLSVLETTQGMLEPLLSLSPAAIVEQAEKGIEAGATLITGQPKQLQVKPSEIIRRPLVEIPQMPQSETPTGQVTAGAANAVIDFANFLQTPEGVSFLGIGALPKAAQRTVAGGISAIMASHAPEQFNAAVEAAKAGNVQEASKQTTAFLGQTALSAIAGRAALTSTGKPILTEVAPKTAEAVKATELPVGPPIEEVPPAIKSLPAPEQPAVEPAGMAAKMPKAIEEAPETVGKPPVVAQDIIGQMAELIDRPVRIGHIGGPQKVLGIFKPSAEVARIRVANDIPVAAHEIAHGLERVHRRALGGIGRKEWTSRIPEEAREELKNLDYDQNQRRVYEGFAEFVRHWTTIGDTATVAPKSHAWFESVFLEFNPELRAGMESIRERIVQFQQQGSRKRVESMFQWAGEILEKIPLKERVVEKARRTQTLFVDDVAPLERIEREILGGALGEGEASPSKLARAVTQASGSKAREWSTYGMTDFAGNKVGPSLREIFSREGIRSEEGLRLGEIAGRDIGRSEKEAILYAAAKRAQELQGRGIDAGIDPADAAQVVKELETPARIQFAQDIRQWNEGALRYLEDASGIARETLDKIVALNQAYIPFFRVLEESRGFGAGGRRIADLPKPVKGIKGSGRQIVNPIEGMQQHVQQIISVADKTRIARSLVNLVESKEGFGKYVEEIPPEKIPVEFSLERIKQQLEEAGVDLNEADLNQVLTLFQNSPRTPKGANIVALVKNGKRHFYELDPELYRALEAVDHQRIHPLLDMTLGKVARGIRLGATGIRAGFTLLTNPMRDFATSLLQSGEVNPIKSTKKFFEHLGKQLAFRDTEIKQLWRATGGEISQPLGLDRRSIQNEVESVLANDLKRKALRIVKHPVEFTRQALSFTEAAPRLAEFELTLRDMGWKPGSVVTPDIAIEAANRAAEVTVNFRRGGAWGRQMNQMVAFYNPAIQGLSVFARSHASHKVRSVARGVGLITLPALANWLANRDDPEWQNFPDWIKWGFFNVKIGDEWVRLPTPFEWWWTYGALPMASVDALYQSGPQEAKDALVQAVKQLAPPVMPSALVPPIEAIADYSFFKQRPIVPESVGQLVPSEQALPYTTETAKKVARILSSGGVEVSPIKVDHILNGETGGLWGDMIGTAEKAVGQAPPESMLEPADIPIVGRMFIRDSASSIMDDFYSELEHLKAKQTTWKKFDQEDNPRASKYVLSDKEEAFLQLGQKKVRELAKLRQEYRESKTREERNRLWREMEAIAKDGLLELE